MLLGQELFVWVKWLGARCVGVALRSFAVLTSDKAGQPMLASVVDEIER